MHQHRTTHHALPTVSLADPLPQGILTTEATALHTTTADMLMTMIMMSQVVLTLGKLTVCLQRMKVWMKESCPLSAGLVLLCD